MIDDKSSILRIQSISTNLLAALDQRDVALWLRCSPSVDRTRAESLLPFIGLPWRLVLLDTASRDVVETLGSKNADVNDPMIRKRGLLQRIDTNPAQIALPERCLPVYLLNGATASPQGTFNDQLRRLAMLEELRQSSARHVLLVSDDDQGVIPPELKDLWDSGFRASVTFTHVSASAEAEIGSWLRAIDGLASATFWRSPFQHVLAEVAQRYLEVFPEGRTIIRMRDQTGHHRTVDITELDEPERPILKDYEVIEERDLTLVQREELSEEEFIAFFENPEGSWRPYAAGLPWRPDPDCTERMRTLLDDLVVAGPADNCVAYIHSESGAGATTLARVLAWEAAQVGYPTLVAKPVPFTPDALSVANFLNRVRARLSDQLRGSSQMAEFGADAGHDRGPEVGRFEIPWLIVFDRVHWEYRDTELRQFRNEMARQGRPVCVLVVSGPVRALSYFDTTVFKKIVELNHVITPKDARDLGIHLNRYLRSYGKVRQMWEWDQFYEEHTVRYVEGVSAFWVALSFWIRGNYDLTESVQAWVYRTFKANVDDKTVQMALIQIAAMSSERHPTPERLLPKSQSKWPTSQLLEDHRSSLGAVGLVAVTSSGTRYWALVHDVLGRYLLNAFFHDHDLRENLGLGEENDPERLRLRILMEISRDAILGEKAYREIGEDFAKYIFKIDPDHGYTSFAPFWRDVLHALDDMPSPLRDSSRVFRHHASVSRRRIAKLNGDIYDVGEQDKLQLLARAIADIEYALRSIPYEVGSEPDLNLFNSLAHAYHDLAELQRLRGADPMDIAKLLRLADDATASAYRANPTNSFVIETFVRNLLASARTDSARTVELCIEALGVLFSAMSSNVESYRVAKLGVLADAALNLLLSQVPNSMDVAVAASAIDVLVNAWVVMTRHADRQSGMALSDIPREDKLEAIRALDHPAGQGNMHVIRLRYELTCAVHPKDFRTQLQYAEQLQTGDYRPAPQVQLEYAILLYQNGRVTEGDAVFRGLRKLWRETEYFVHVPGALRWLRDLHSGDRRTVNAIVGSDRDLRPMARVKEFASKLVPFRPEEFGLRTVPPGFRFSAYVSYGHNGPFLRPITAQPS